METVTNFIFLGSNIHVDGDCGHKINRYLCLERKAMINLDSILRSIYNTYISIFSLTISLLVVEENKVISFLVSLLKNFSWGVNIPLMKTAHCKVKKKFFFEYCS